MHICPGFYLKMAAEIPINIKQPDNFTAKAVLEAVYVYLNIKDSGSEATEPIASTKNSKGREIVKPFVSAIDKLLITIYPDITPNQITCIGTLMVTTGAYLSLEAARKDSNELRAISGCLLLAGAELDAQDGYRATQIEKESPERHNPIIGQLVDVGADRAEETIQAIFEAIAAFERCDRIGEYLTYLKIVSNCTPSLIRSVAELCGIILPEDGKDCVGFFGSRAGRIFLQFTERELPQNPEYNLPRHILAIFSIGANVKTSIDRINAIVSHQSLGRLPSGKQKEALLRAPLLALLTVGAAAGAYGTYRYLRTHDSQSLHYPNMFREELANIQLTYQDAKLFGTKLKKRVLEKLRGEPSAIVIN